MTVGRSRFHSQARTGLRPTAMAMTMLEAHDSMYLLVVPCQLKNLLVTSCLAHVRMRGRQGEKNDDPCCHLHAKYHHFTIDSNHQTNDVLSLPTASQSVVTIRSELVKQRLKLAHDNFFSFDSPEAQTVREETQHKVTCSACKLKALLVERLCCTKSKVEEAIANE
jgi:hypothetical protein